MARAKVDSVITHPGFSPMRNTSASVSDQLTDLAAVILAHNQARDRADERAKLVEAELAALRAEKEAAQKAFDEWNAPRARLARAEKALLLYTPPIVTSSDTRLTPITSAVRRINECIERIRKRPGETTFEDVQEHGRLDAAREALIQLNSRKWNSPEELLAAVDAIARPFLM